MAALRASNLILKSSITSSSSHRREITKATINIPKRARNISLPILQTKQFQELDQLQKHIEKQLSPSPSPGSDSSVIAKLYAILEAVADRVEMHTNIGDQRNDWNTLLLTSINALTLAAATMAAIAAISGGAPAAKLSSTAMYVAATGMLSVMNKIQPSQLAEEQRNATRLFKQLQNQIKTMISIGNPTAMDVKETMEKVLALDRAYPLPLLGAMLEKFPAEVEPAVWWPGPEQRRRKPKVTNQGYNGWNGNLEREMREIVKVVRRQDKEDYLRLGRKALKLSKFLGISGPVLTGLAAVGSTMVGSPSHGGWAAVLGIVGGALASVVNSIEHGGQVGMVFEMYRGNAGFFQQIEETIEANLMEEDLERRENGEMLEMKLGLQLGRSLSQLRDLAEVSSVEGEAIDEFASKLF